MIGKLDESVNSSQVDNREKIANFDSRTVKIKKGLHWDAQTPLCKSIDILLQISFHLYIISCDCKI